MSADGSGLSGLEPSWLAALPDTIRAMAGVDPGGALAGAGWVPAGLTPGAFWAVLAIFVFGGVVKGGLGFGLPLATISILPLVVPVEMALAINTVVQPVTNVSQLVGSRRVRETAARFWPMGIALALGVAFGAAMLSGLSADRILLILGLFVMLFSVVSATGFAPRIPPGRERAAGFATGLAAGAIGSLTAANGPVFVMYLLGLGVDREGFRAALGFLFIVSGALIAAGFVGIGILDWGRAALALACIPSALIGMEIGNRIGRRLPRQLFLNVVLIALFCLGLRFALRGAGLL